MRITKTRFPRLFEALELISLDNGTHRWFEDTLSEMNTTMEEATKAESQLSPMNQDEFEDFVIGERIDQEQLPEANRLLNQFFELL